MCNQHTHEHHSKSSVRLAQAQGRIKERKKKGSSRQKSTHTHVCVTQVKRVHTYHSKSLQNGANLIPILSCHEKTQKLKQ